MVSEAAAQPSPGGVRPHRKSIRRDAAVLTSAREIFNKCNTMKKIAPALIVTLAVLISTTGLAAKKKAAATASPAPSASPAAKASASPTASPATKKVRLIPFKGIVSSVDGRAKTFTIAGKEKSRVFKINPNSMITKAGQPATAKDIVEKEEARGSYWKEDDGTLMARTVKLGPLTDAEKAAVEKAKQRRAARKAAKEVSTDASPAPSASPAASAKP